VYLGHFLGWKLFNHILFQFDHQSGWLALACMLVCLLYLPRKKKLFTLGKVRFWYKLHIAFGLAGSILAIFHAYGDFHGLGGILILTCWLVMATGIIGHFIYRRLPEEVEHRSLEREIILKKLDEIKGVMEIQNREIAELEKQLAKTGPLANYTEHKKVHLPRPSLGRHISRITSLWQEFRKTTLQTKKLAAEVKKLASLEKHTVELRKARELELLHLQNDTKNFLVLNEIYSLWKKFHGPLSYFMWWILGLHIFAWIYY
jgi:hypothetical protein